jgi:hypothetical protein
MEASLKFCLPSAVFILMKVYPSIPLSGRTIWGDDTFNPLPHGVLATFSLTAWGFIGPPKKDDISREKGILVTSLRTYRASAVSSPGLHYTYPPLPPAPLRGHWVHKKLSADLRVMFKETEVWSCFLIKFNPPSKEVMDQIFFHVQTLLTECCIGTALKLFCLLVCYPYMHRAVF